MEDTHAAPWLDRARCPTARGDSEREQTYLRLFAQGRLAGLIVVPHDRFADDLHRIRSGGAPVVVVDRDESGAGQHVRGGGRRHRGRLAAAHLIALGHRHLAFVGDEAAAAPVHDRLTGVRKAIAEAKVDVRLDVLPAELTVEAGRARGEALPPCHPTGGPPR